MAKEKFTVSIAKRKSREMPSVTSEIATAESPVIMEVPITASETVSATTPIVMVESPVAEITILEPPKVLTRSQKLKILKMKLNTALGLTLAKLRSKGYEISMSILPEIRSSKQDCKCARCGPCLKVHFTHEKLNFQTFFHVDDTSFWTERNGVLAKLQLDDSEIFQKVEKLAISALSN